VIKAGKMDAKEEDEPEANLGSSVGDAPLRNIVKSVFQEDGDLHEDYNVNVTNFSDRSTRTRVSEPSIENGMKVKVVLKSVVNEGQEQWDVTNSVFEKRMEDLINATAVSTKKDGHTTDKLDTISYEEDHAVNDTVTVEEGVTSEKEEEVVSNDRDVGEDEARDSIDEASPPRKNKKRNQEKIEAGWSGENARVKKRKVLENKACVENDPDMNSHQIEKSDSDEFGEKNQEPRSISENINDIAAESKDGVYFLVTNEDRSSRWNDDYLFMCMINVRFYSNDRSVRCRCGKIFNCFKSTSSLSYNFHLVPGHLLKCREVTHGLKNKLGDLRGTKRRKGLLHKFASVIMNRKDRGGVAEDVNERCDADDRSNEKVAKRKGTIDEHPVVDKEIATLPGVWRRGDIGLTPYEELVMRNFLIFEHHELNGSSTKRRGISCRFCLGKEQFHPKSADLFRKMFRDYSSHLMLCEQCPDAQKTLLLHLKDIHPPRRGKPSDELIKLWQRIWERLHMHDPFSDEKISFPKAT